MIFVTGPLFAGKQEYIMKALGWDEAAFEKNAVRDVQDLAALTPFDESEELAAVTPADSLEALADSLASKQVVIATEVGGGVVPLDPVQRREREAAGRLACYMVPDVMDKVTGFLAGRQEKKAAAGETAVVETE